MFLFKRSIWTVAAGLGTALAVVGLSFILDRPPGAPAGGTPEAPTEAHDISLAKR